MAETTEISWADSTFNPFIGCTKVSAGCDNCYTEALMDKRMHKVQWGPGQPRVRTSASNWHQPVKWNATPFFKCAECAWRGGLSDLVNSKTDPCPWCPMCGRGIVPARRRVFCASLADVFDNEVPLQWRIDLFDLIRKTPNLDYLLLTKRIGNAAEMMREAFGLMSTGVGTYQPMPNVHLGATMVNQDEIDRDLPKLLYALAAVRFLSLEPLLGPIVIPPVFLQRLNLGEGPKDWPDDAGIVDHVIVGGESGRGARACEVEWIRDIVEQCTAAGTPVFVKQLGANVEWRGMSGAGQHWPEDVGSADRGNGRFRMLLTDKKGGDMNQWPDDLRVREFPNE